MGDSGAVEERGDDRWVDYETLAAQCAERLRAKGWDPHFGQGFASLDAYARRRLESRCKSASEIIGMAGGRIEFQPTPDSDYDVRYRVWLGERREPAVLQDQQSFIDWARENRPIIVILARRRILAESVPEPKSSSSCRTSRAL